MIIRYLPLIFLFAILPTAVLPSCTRHEIDVKPVEIKPIHITIDVNVKVDRALDNFFEDIDEAAYGETAKDKKRKSQ